MQKQTVDLTHAHTVGDKRLNIKTEYSRDYWNLFRLFETMTPLQPFIHTAMVKTQILYYFHTLYCLCSSHMSVLSKRAVVIKAVATLLY